MGSEPREIDPGGGQDRESPAPATCVAQKLSESDLVHAELLSKRERLERHRELGGEHEVVDELGHLTAAERAEMHHGVAEGLEDRSASFGCLLSATHHHQEGTRCGSWAAAAHWGVDHVDTTFASPSCQLLTGVGVHR